MDFSDVMPCVQSLAGCAKMPRMQKTHVIGIVGGSGCGKSTLARALADQLGACQISTDDYYLPHEPARANFDTPESLNLPELAVHVERLLAGKSARVPVYDFVRGQAVDCRTVTPKKFVVVEGLFLYAYAPLRSLITTKIFVDLPDSVRLIRRLQRDIVQRRRIKARSAAALRTALGEELDYYQNCVQTGYKHFIAPYRHESDIIIDGSVSKQSLQCLAKGLAMKLANGSRQRSGARPALAATATKGALDKGS